MPHASAPHLVDFASTLLTALLASFHCAGMCGGFVLGAAAGQGIVSSQGLYHLGKSTTYLGLGAMAGLAGETLAASGADWSAIRWLALVAAAAMIGVGVKALGFFPRRGGNRVSRVAPPVPLDRAGDPGPVTAVLHHAAAYRGPARALVLGTLSGLLPCPLVYAFLAKGAASGSVVSALLTMAALGLGTVPVLGAVAACGRILSPALRGRMVRLSGVFMVLLGVYTLWRGFVPLPCCAH